ncbi:hypothetical protein DSO57_1038604 [Entomophthora muscae]|uniref:Uncharacterized protein n=1 Tax=Entomophthora muscae TaxID=34485 RepID=A0ACC2TXQ4_9FUNG|nr:hypothetical protein DSO57_1038604 [Entomophthora muscae]
MQSWETALRRWLGRPEKSAGPPERCAEAYWGEPVASLTQMRGQGQWPEAVEKQLEAWVGFEGGGAGVWEDQGLQDDSDLRVLIAPH